MEIDLAICFDKIYEIIPAATNTKVITIKALSINSFINIEKTSGGKLKTMSKIFLLSEPIAQP